jgi:site-specific DNA-cytosine methylase
LAGALASQPGMKQTTYLYYSHDYNQDRVYRADGISEAATASRKPNFLINNSVRRLTPLECERLQGFPDGWTDIPGNSDTQRYRQLGNAVAVPVAEWLMRRIADAA